MSAFWPIATDRILVAERRFRGITNMAGTAAGRTRTRMTQSGHLARLGRRPVPSACTLCHTQQPSECATVKLILAWSFAGGVTRPIGAAFVACAAHAQQPATPRSKTIFITLPCVLVTAWPFATSRSARWPRPRYPTSSCAPIPGHGSFSVPDQTRTSVLSCESWF